MTPTPEARVDVLGESHKLSTLVTRPTSLEAPTANADNNTSTLDVAKDYLGVTGTFLQTILKKVPDVVDGNPVKMFFSLAKVIVELKEVGSFPYDSSIRL